MNYVKLPLNFFDGNKLKAIRSQKDGDSIILFYVMLITVTVKSNVDGRLMLCEDIPYDDKILSSILIQIPYQNIETNHSLPQTLLITSFVRDMSE